jgi:hypothetical protein
MAESVIGLRCQLCAKELTFLAVKGGLTALARALLESGKRDHAKACKGKLVGFAAAR